MLDGLLPHQAEAVGKTMRRIHRDWRVKRGQQPLPNVWTDVNEEFLARTLDELDRMNARTSLSDDALMGSHRKGVGGAIKRARHAVWKILKPVFDRQTAVNEDLVRILAAVAADRERTMRLVDALSTRISELEHRAGIYPRGR